MWYMYMVLEGKLKEGDHTEGLGIAGKIICRWVLKK